MASSSFVTNILSQHSSKLYIITDGYFNLIFVTLSHCFNVYQNEKRFHCIVDILATVNA